MTKSGARQQCGARCAGGRRCCLTGRPHRWHICQSVGCVCKRSAPADWDDNGDAPAEPGPAPAVREPEREARE